MAATPPSPPPTAPAPGDCCGGGCARCVWDVYDAELAAWQAAQRPGPSSGEAGH